MHRFLRLSAITTLLLAGTSARAQAPADVEWRSMSAAKVAVPLPPSSPMATELAAPKPVDVPLPPPPPGTKLTSAPAPAPAAATGGAASATGLAAIAAADTSPAPAAAEGSKEPRVTMAADQTGAMVSVTQDLESDRLRQDWAASGGTLPGFEANVGMTMMYKDLSTMPGGVAGSYMSGVGFNFGGRVVLYNLTPPKYETRDRNWIAWKIGGGIDLGMLASTSYIPATTYSYTVGGRTYSSTSGPFDNSASMTTMTLVGSIGFMYAFGGFDSPNEWSGLAVGADWAPSYQSTSMTDSTTNQTTSSSAFNAMGFALNIESGSMQSIAAKMGKKARFKASVFFLPPTGDLPLLVTGSVGAVWY